MTFQIISEQAPNWYIFNYIFFKYINKQNLTAFIDFTASNKQPELPDSLHYTGDIEKNQYIQALKSVGEILIQYDHDHQVPIYGFGGFFQKKTSHCFPLDPQKEEVYGVEGMIAAYHVALKNCQLSGPTQFLEILTKA